MVYSWRQYYMEGKGQIQASESLTPRGKKPSTPSIRLGMNARVGLEMLISATAGQRTQFYRSPNRNFSHYTAWSTSAPNLSSYSVLEIWFGMKNFDEFGLTACCIPPEWPLHDHVP